MKEIPLLRGGVALVDDEDFEHLSKWAWTVNKGYPSRRYTDENGKRKRVYMHKVIMGRPFTDHIDHNPLNNQKKNLRLADFRTNGRNRVKQTNAAHSIYKGVTKDFKRNGLGFRWRAQIGVGGQKKNKGLGYFNTEVEAALAYDFSASSLYGEFACLNKYQEGLAI